MGWDGRNAVKKGHLQKHIHEVTVECFTSSVPHYKKIKYDMLSTVYASSFYFAIGVV